MAKTTCKIEYVYNVIEPNFTYSKNFTDDYDTTYSEINEEEYYFPYSFSGRLNYFTINIKEDISTNCVDGCGLCLLNDNEKCFHCEDDYEIIISEGKEYKNCIMFVLEEEEFEE